jgi:hypothetical protein
VNPDQASETGINEIPEELKEHPSSAEENAHINTAKLDANKKGKIAHSVIEKNYRSRLADGPLSRSTPVLTILGLLDWHF